MNVTLESVIKKAEVEAELTGNFTKYISLLSALEPYGYGSEQLKKLCAYKVEETSFDEYDRFFERDFYSLLINPTYMYRVDGYYIFAQILDEDNEIQSTFYIENTSDAFLREKIKMNKFTKNDFIEMVKAAKDFIDIEYPKMIITDFTIEGENEYHTFKSLLELENTEKTFSNFHSLLNGDT